MGVTRSKFSFKKSSLAAATTGTAAASGTTRYTATRAGRCSERVPTLSRAPLGDFSSRNSGYPLLQMRTMLLREAK